MDKKVWKELQDRKGGKSAKQDERDRIKELEEEVKVLREERDLGKLKNLALETLIDIANKEFKTDIKKTLDPRRPDNKVRS